MAKKTTGLTPKQIHFCREVVSGQSLSASYKAAYSTGNMSAGAVYVESSRLMANPKISLRVEQLNRAKDRALVGSAVSDRDRVLNKLRDMMDSAEAENVQLNAAVALGKTQALFTNVVQEKKDTRTPAEIKAELEERLGRLLGKPDFRFN